jgi:broad specificity phosphatase PhoE
VGDAVAAIAAGHPGSRLLLVAHGGVVRSLQRLVLGEPEPVLANGATWQCGYLDGRLVRPLTTLDGCETPRQSQ